MKHRVQVKTIGGGEITRLYVNGWGIASWPAKAIVAGTSATGRAYALECARVLRIALRLGEKG